MSQTLKEIKEEYLAELDRICDETRMDLLQRDVIKRISGMIFDRGYQVGLDHGWSFEQDAKRQQSDGDE